MDKLKCDYLYQNQYITELIEKKDTYKIVNESKRKFKRKIFDLCFKLMQKFGSVSPAIVKETRQSLQRIELDFRNIEKLIHEQMNQYRKLYVKPRLVVVGHSQLDKLLLSVTTPISLQFPNNYPVQQFAGVDIVLLPYFDGVLVIPDWEQK